MTSNLDKAIITVKEATSGEIFLAICDATQVAPRSETYLGTWIDPMDVTWIATGDALREIAKELQSL